MDFKEHVFLADVHLGAFSASKNKAIERDVIALIEHCREQHIALYILGDLFDYWMEFPQKNIIPDLGKNVLNAFEQYNKTVAPALFITGNHDNWTFGHFEERGFDVEENYRVISVDELQFLLMHGDGLAQADFDFPRGRLHRFLRNPAFISVYQKLLPARLALTLMKEFSNLTRKRNVLDPERINKVANRILRHRAIDVVMTGHDHIPRKKKMQNKLYINPGTFFKHRSVARYTNHSLELVKWAAESKKFVTFEGK